MKLDQLTHAEKEYENHRKNVAKLAFRALIAAIKEIEENSEYVCICQWSGNFTVAGKIYNFSELND